MKYRLILTDKDPMNNQVIECDTAREAYTYKKKSEAMGFKVTIKKFVKLEVQE